MAFDLAEYADAHRVPQPEKFTARCGKLRDMLCTVNQHVNLTRITGAEEFAVKHIADALSIADFFPEIATERLLVADIGCGAGFPSLVLALAWRNLNVTAIDSTGKKIDFVAAAADELGLKNIRPVKGRSIELNRKKEYQGRFDIVTARAVAPGMKLVSECDKMPKARTGRFIFYKTPVQVSEDMEALSRAADRFSLRWHASAQFSLPENQGERQFIWSEQIPQ